MNKLPTLVFLLLSFSVFGQTLEDYRVGDQWGKKRVTPENLKNESAVFQRAAQATAYLPVGGTSFYLGKFNGEHVIATNHHVCPAAADCVGDKANFRLLKKNFKITKLYITLEDVDLSLLSIAIPVEDEALMAKVGKNFTFRKDIKKGTELLTIGFGIGGNPNNNLMANQDSDCKVFSTDGEYMHMSDPDDINPGYYKAWSFAHACDISHGDSGSAMVDRNTGDVVGIVWTGKLPKSEVAQHSDSLAEMYNSNSKNIWKELSYAVPAVKIAEYLRDLSEDSHVEESTRKVFKAMLK